jgi:hypothetical protein
MMQMRLIADEGGKLTEANVTCNWAKGVWLFENGKLGQAASALRKGLKVDPDCADLKAQLEMVQEQQAEGRQAEEARRQREVEKHKAEAERKQQQRKQRGGAGGDKFSPAAAAAVANRFSRGVRDRELDREGITKEELAGRYSFLALMCIARQSMLSRLLNFPVGYVRDQMTTPLTEWTASESVNREALACFDRTYTIMHERDGATGMDRTSARDRFLVYLRNLWLAPGYETTHLHPTFESADQWSVSLCGSTLYDEALALCAEHPDIEPRLDVRELCYADEAAHVSAETTKAILALPLPTALPKRTHRGRLTLMGNEDVAGHHLVELVTDQPASSGLVREFLEALASQLDFRDAFAEGQYTTVFYVPLTTTGELLTALRAGEVHRQYRNMKVTMAIAAPSE